MPSLPAKMKLLLILAKIHARTSVSLKYLENDYCLERCCFTRPQRGKKNGQYCIIYSWHFHEKQNRSWRKEETETKILRGNSTRSNLQEIYSTSKISKRNLWRPTRKAPTTTYWKKYCCFQPVFSKKSVSFVKKLLKSIIMLSKI